MFESVDARTLDLRHLKLVDIDSVQLGEHRNMVDVEIKEDHTFCLADGIISHNSARNSIQSARGKNQLIGSFSLRGKPMNVYDAATAEVIANREFANILTVTGLQLGEKVRSVTQLRFGKLVVLSDQDLDGFHVSSLVMSFFAKYWPELFELGVIYRMNTPLYVASTGKGELHEFFTEEDYINWAAKAPKHKAEYYKGLGGFDTDMFERFLENREKYLVQITALEAADLAKFELAFSNVFQDERKSWLAGVQYFEDLDK